MRLSLVVSSRIMGSAVSSPIRVGPHASYYTKRTLVSALSSSRLWHDQPRHERSLLTTRDSSWTADSRIRQGLNGSGSHGTTTNVRLFSSTHTSNVDEGTYEDDEDRGPTGELIGLHFNTTGDGTGPAARDGSIMISSLVGKSAQIRRTFGPRSNREILLCCGGAALAKHASFDPNYSRAQQWIRHHAVGPAVLSSALLSGLLETLVEAVFPEAITLACSTEFVQPLIVGVEIQASILVDRVESGEDDPQSNTQRVSDSNTGIAKNGSKVYLRTEIKRLRDDLLLAHGTQTIWIPNYQQM